MTWKEVLTYLYNLSVVWKDFKDHLGNISKAFDRLHLYNLKLKPKKCHFFQTEVPFLGQLATTKGVPVDPYKVKVVLEWPMPSRKKDVSFLALPITTGTTLSNMPTLLFLYRS